MVTDMQGIGGLMTDPCLHTMKGFKLLDGDLKENGIAAFLNRHKCNEVCKALGLKENK
jgi:hypothetical protein